MHVSKDKIKMGVTNYIDNELGRKADGIGKFAVYFMIPRINRNVDQMIDNYKDNVLFSDMVEEDEIDIDKLYDDAKEAMRKAGHVTIMNITFNEEDIDSLYRYIIGG